MSTKRSTSEAAVLEQYRVSLENATTQPNISAVMADYGYDTTKIAEGNQLLEATRKAYDANKTENDETATASLAFTTAKDALETLYTPLRKKAKVVFMNEPDTLKQLQLDGQVPNAYSAWFEYIVKFFTTIKADASLLTKLARLKVTAAQIDEGLAQIEAVKTARAEYIRESGESQAATQTKDSAFETIDKWMREFYAVAKIALDDQPQLLEVLAKKVRS